jgi:CDGSH-type Zn-finger protein
MSTPEIPAKAAFAVELKAGQTYWWCACGRSATQPFCDGSHRGTGFEPVKIVPTHTAMAWLCGCKHSARAPLCDGTHNRL